MIDINKITWLHISDLHMRPSNVVDSDIVLEKLLEDVEKCIQKDSLQPGFIILTGDISYSGKPEEYEVAQKFLDKLLKISDLGKDRIFIVPGNHDVDRGMITTAARIIADSINNRDSINGILASDVDRAFILQRFHNYKKFIDEYCGKDVLLFNNEHYYYAKNIPIANLNLSILGLNSALLAGSDKDQEKLVLGDTQVRKALAEVENADICIAIMHHPFDWLQKFDRDDIESSLSRECEFILHGHLHEQSIHQISGPSRFSTIVGAGACFEKRTFFNSYNFVQLDLDSGMGRIYLRMYSDKDGGFWTKDTITYSGAPDGEYEFPLSTKICKPSEEKSSIESQKPKVEFTPKVAQLIGIPLKPEPYFAHFFHLQANFTGRVKERRMLTDWFYDDGNPILALIAIGGMGKSSLAWYWLKNDIDHSSLEGIFWWSFYEGEASFAKFLDAAIIYASGKEINPIETKSSYEKSRILLLLLQQNKFLFVLDGFERQLGTYDLNEESPDGGDSEDEMALARTCVDPYFGRFLCDLVSSEPKTKILITSRMRIRDLEDVSGNSFDGCLMEELKQFNHDDAFSFMKAQGVKKGTQKEILDACEVYRYHPLSLRLLSGLIARSLQNPGDISVAP